MKGVVLITTLNPLVLPNAASVESQNPDHLILIEQPALNRGIEGMLRKSRETLEAWCEGLLEERYKFRKDEVSFAPKYPGKTPIIHVIEADDSIILEQEITAKIEELRSDYGEELAVRFECNAGRKEDAAKIIDLCNAEGGTSWYTDVDTGISVQIGAKGSELPAKRLCDVTRFWLEWFPVVAGKEIQEIESKELLGIVLDCLSEGEIPIGEEEISERLAKKGVEMEIGIESPNSISFKKTGESRVSDFTISDEVLEGGGASRGEWLEDLAALSLAESLGRGAKIIKGARWTHFKPNNRRMEMINSLKTKDNPWVFETLKFVFEYFSATGELPEEYQEIGSLLDGDELGSRGGNSQLRKEFVTWLREGWGGIPAEIRRKMLQVSTRRELDVLAFSDLGTFYVECKLGAYKFWGPQRKHANYQLGSLVGALGGHRNVTKLVVHSKTGEDVEVEEGALVMGWDRLREIRKTIGPS